MQRQTTVQSGRHAIYASSRPKHCKHNCPHTPSLRGIHRSSIFVACFGREDDVHCACCLSDLVFIIAGKQSSRRPCGAADFFFPFVSICSYPPRSRGLPGTGPGTARQRKQGQGRTGRKGRKEGKERGREGACLRRGKERVCSADDGWIDGHRRV
jgi:hypothetical protein